MRKTICEKCGEVFIEEHEPENFVCEKCWDKSNNKLEEEYTEI